MMTRLLPAISLLLLASCSGSTDGTDNSAKAASPVTKLDAAGMRQLVEGATAEEMTKLSARGQFNRHLRLNSNTTSAALVACGTSKGWWAASPQGSAGTRLSMTQTGNALFGESTVDVSTAATSGLRLSTPTRGRYESVAPFVQADPSQKPTIFSAESVRANMYPVDEISPSYLASATYYRESPFTADLNACGMEVEISKIAVGKLYAVFAKRSFADQWLLYGLGQGDTVVTTTWK